MYMHTLASSVCRPRCWRSLLVFKMFLRIRFPHPCFRDHYLTVVKRGRSSTSTECCSEEERERERAEERKGSGECFGYQIAPSSEISRGALLWQFRLRKIPRPHLHPAPHRKLTLPRRLSSSHISVPRQYEAFFLTHHHHLLFIIPYQYPHLIPTPTSLWRFGHPQHGARHLLPNP